MPELREIVPRPARWHGGASKNKPPPRVGASEQDTPAETSEPDTPAEMFAALKLTTDQQRQFDLLEKERKAAEAKFRDLSGASLQNAKNGFYSERKKKLEKIFTAEQWLIWSGFWSRARSESKP